MSPLRNEEVLFREAERLNGLFLVRQGMSLGNCASVTFPQFTPLL